jgi:hypothetical protein
MGRRKKKETGILSWFILLVGVIALVQTACTEWPNQQQQPDVPMMPEVARFLSEHRTFGTARTVRNAADWEKGKRQLIQFDTGRTLLFYEKDGVVVAVYDMSEPAGVLRGRAWGEYGPEIVNMEMIQTGADPEAATPIPSKN